MQANYPKKLPRSCWDTLNLEYPVKKFPETALSSETVGRKWRDQPEVKSSLKEPVGEIRAYDRNFNVTKELTQSQYAVDFAFKYPETRRFNKHTSCNENLYIYPPSRRLTDQPPQCTAHGTTEMRSAFTTPTISSRLVTDKDQYKHPASLPPDPPTIEPSWHKELAPLDTTHEGFEKYLDPYLTTSRLYHRPYTAEQLSRQSVSKDIVTYHTYTKEPWIHTVKPQAEEWSLPRSIKRKSIYDKEKFKDDFREIRTHNKLNWVPGTFRTETRDNYVPQTSRPESRIHNAEEEVRTHYERSIANLPTNVYLEHSTIKKLYSSENSQVGSGKPLCSMIDQYVEKNKRVERKSVRV